MIGLVKLYILELADRCVRMRQHLDQVEAEFYRGFSALGTVESENAPKFLESFREATNEIMLGCVNMLKVLNSEHTSSDLDTIFTIGKSGFLLLQTLHEQGLASLPRPAVPVEVRRFNRIISEHVLKNPKLKISLYITESISETTFSSDPIGAIRNRELALFSENVSSLLSDISTPQNSVQTVTRDTIDITIPRIDTQCPVSWATLLHEAAHKVFEKDFITNGTFSDSIRSELNPSVFESLNSLEIDLESWATEIWCDIFAAYVMGPALFFSQYRAFIAVPPMVPQKLSETHPPSSLRLKLIKTFLDHQNPIVKDLRHNSVINQRIKLVEELDRQILDDEKLKPGLRVFFDVMRFQCRRRFFTGTSPGAKKFQKRYSSMVKFVRSIEAIRVDRIYEELRNELPAPSIRTSEDFTEEEPTSIQEVLLAASMVREFDLLKRIEGAFQYKDTSLSFNDLVRGLISKYNRVDEAILKSLQLSEWLFMFDQRVSDPNITSVKPVELIKTKAPPLLNDVELYSLLRSGELRVTPIVDLNQQLGSSSLDLRLGTSFETFLPNSRHSPDDGPDDLDHYHSRRIDLDFLEHVILLPGEFMLAHTFEYLRLPSWIAGELEGRSTYARLGLEVHMTAGMIDPGFEGTATLELYNGGPNSIRLFPGTRVAQIRFRAVDPPEHPYSRKLDAKYRGQLQHHTSLYRQDRDHMKICRKIDDRRNPRLARRKNGG